MTSIRRFYSNAYTDAEKQDAINLFLGRFVPSTAGPQIWDLEGEDTFLHSSGARPCSSGCSFGSGSSEICVSTL